MQEYQDLKGIRQRGNSFQFNVSYKGKRFVGGAPTLVEAIQERAKALKALQEAPDIQNTGDEDPAIKASANVKRLATVFELTARTCWDGNVNNLRDSQNLH